MPTELVSWLKLLSRYELLEGDTSPGPVGGRDDVGCRQNVVGEGGAVEDVVQDERFAVTHRYRQEARNDARLLVGGLQRAREAQRFRLLRRVRAPVLEGVDARGGIEVNPVDKIPWVAVFNPGTCNLVLR